MYVYVVTYVRWNRPSTKEPRRSKCRDRVYAFFSGAAVGAPESTSGHLEHWAPGHRASSGFPRFLVLQAEQAEISARPLGRGELDFRFRRTVLACAWHLRNWPGRNRRSSSSQVVKDASWPLRVHLSAPRILFRPCRRPKRDCSATGLMPVRGPPLLPEGCRPADPVQPYLPPRKCLTPP
jgi:hypothetical protein